MDDLRLFDMHCHLDDFDDPPAVARELAALGVGTLAVTTTPRKYGLARDLTKMEGVWLAPGLHPWQFGEYAFDPNQVDDLLNLVGENRFVGEIGLDFYERHAPESSWNAQRHALLRIFQACAEASDPQSPHVLSIHSVRAAGEVLDLLERTGCDKRCHCIFHWFSGSTDELWRAIRMGCWFSCGPHMMKVKRSREYVKLIPATKLLLETDYPPHDHWASPAAWAAEVRDALLSAAASIAAARGSAAEEIMGLARKNSLALLD